MSTHTWQPQGAFLEQLCELPLHYPAVPGGCLALTLQPLLFAVGAGMPINAALGPCGSEGLQLAGTGEPSVVSPTDCHNGTAL